MQGYVVVVRYICIGTLVLRHLSGTQSAQTHIGSEAATSAEPIDERGCFSDVGCGNERMYVLSDGVEFPQMCFLLLL